MVQKQTSFTVAEVQLVYKSKCDITLRPKISKSSECYSLLLSNWNQDTIELCEEFKILLLNRANKVLAISTISQGGTAGTVVDPKLLFTTALKLKASSLILAHNHPSGELKPSEQDIIMTRKLIEGGKVLDVIVLDHLIISPNGYYSMGDEGLM
ncbi:MAG: JAB domain-containing protein [Pedobacter sp.]